MWWNTKLGWECWFNKNGKILGIINPCFDGMWRKKYNFFSIFSHIKNFLVFLFKAVYQSKNKIRYSNQKLNMECNLFNKNYYSKNENFTKIFWSKISFFFVIFREKTSQNMSLFILNEQNLANIYHLLI